jgi:branched-chain amino acid transport system substrate-binding protein
MRRRGERGTLRRFFAATAGSLILITACTGNGGSDPPATIVTTTTEVAEPRLSDGILKIGALIPSGDAAIGAPLTDSVTNAVAQVNDAGGVLGNEVELIIADEGPSAVTASQAIEDLAAQGVDAIVGPTSSNSALGSLDTAIAAGVVTCSATATAIALDGFPDDGLFFRSIATDSLQAAVIADTARRTGTSRVVIVHVEDAYGRPYADAVTEALGDGISVETVAIPLDDGDLTDDVDALAVIDPEVVVVVGSGEDIAAFLEAMGQHDDLDVSTIIVNDSARSAASRPVIAGLPATIRNRVTLVAPQIVLRNSARAVDDPPFDAQVTDCVNLLALSAVQGQSDSPEVIAQQMPSVSDGGAVCRGFAACAERLAADDDQQINYDGPTGLTVLGRNGDPSRAFFDRFRFGAEGEDIFVSKEAFSYA